MSMLPSLRSVALCLNPLVLNLQCDVPLGGRAWLTREVGRVGASFSRVEVGWTVSTTLYAFSTSLSFWPADSRPHPVRFSLHFTHCFCSEFDQLQGQEKLVYQMAGQVHWANSIRLHHLESV